MKVITWPKSVMFCDAARAAPASGNSRLPSTRATMIGMIDVDALGLDQRQKSGSDPQITAPMKVLTATPQPTAPATCGVASSLEDGVSANAWANPHRTHMTSGGAAIHLAHALTLLNPNALLNIMMIPHPSERILTSPGMPASEEMAMPSRLAWNEYQPTEAMMMSAETRSEPARPRNVRASRVSVWPKREPR